MDKLPDEIILEISFYLPLVSLQLFLNTSKKLRKLRAKTSLGKLSSNDPLGKILNCAVEINDLFSVHFILRKFSQNKQVYDYELHYDALCTAARYGHKNLVLHFMELMKIGPIVDCFIMENAIRGGHTDLVQFFIDKGYSDYQRGLEQAASAGNKSMVDFFIAKGVDADSGAWFTSMLRAVGGHHWDLAEFFYEKGNFNTTLNEALAEITLHEDREQIDFFIRKGANDWDSALCSAIHKNNRELIDFFIQKGAKHWNQGMRSAAMCCNMELIKFFALKGANNWDESLLACIVGRTNNSVVSCLEAVKYFIEQGATQLDQAAEEAEFWENQEILEYIASKRGVAGGLML